MARSKRKAVSEAPADLAALGQEIRDNPYVKRLIEDADLRDNLRSAYDSARKAYGRMNGKGPAKSIMEDKRVQKELRSAADSLKSASEALRKPAKRKRARGGLRLAAVGIVGAGLAVAVNEGLRKKVLDALFGAEEEFEYTSTTTPTPTPQTTAA